MIVTGGFGIDYVLLAVWLISLSYSLWRLRNITLDGTAKAAWAALILLVPIAGALAFLVVWAGKEGKKK